MYCELWIQSKRRVCVFYFPFLFSVSLMLSQLLNASIVVSEFWTNKKAEDGVSRSAKKWIERGRKIDIGIVYIWNSNCGSNIRTTVGLPPIHQKCNCLCWGSHKAIGLQCDAIDLTNIYTGRMMRPNAIETFDCGNSIQSNFNSIIM